MNKQNYKFLNELIDTHTDKYIFFQYPIFAQLLKYVGGVVLQRLSAENEECITFTFKESIYTIIFRLNEDCQNVITSYTITQIL